MGYAMRGAMLVAVLLALCGCDEVAGNELAGAAQFE
jgi:hypothetical protein